MTDSIPRRLRRSLASKLLDFLNEGDELGVVESDNTSVVSESSSEPAECNKTQLSLGYIRLSDAAPLIVAVEQGLFAKQGLDVTLVQEASWASIRDKVVAGMLDGAQMPATMPLASTLGAAGPQHPMVAAYTLSCGGNAITLSRQLFRELCEIDAALQNDMSRAGQALKQHIEGLREAGKPMLTMAMVFSTSTHSYLLRHWLAQAGIDPDNDVRLAVIPPSQMADNLANGNIAGFCAGEPWNSKAIADRSGIAVATSSSLWPGHPEKVLGLSLNWLANNPQTADKMVEALAEASEWLCDLDNRPATVSLLSKSEWLNQPAELLQRSLTNQFQYAPEVEASSAEEFHGFGPLPLNRPNSTSGLWWLAQMYRWGHQEQPVALTNVVSAVYDSAVFDRALGVSDDDIFDEVGPVGDAISASDPLQYLMDCRIGQKPQWMVSALSATDEA